MKGKITSIIIIAIIFLAVIPACSPEADAVDVHSGNFLLDFGNGNTEWIELKSGSTVASTVKNSVTNAGHTYAISGGDMKIDGFSTATLGATGTGTFYDISTSTKVEKPLASSTVSWYAYTWSGSEWIVCTNINTSFSGQYLAIGYYSAGTVPTETPTYKSSWTMIEGDSNNSCNQTTNLDDSDPTLVWQEKPKSAPSGDYSSILYARGLAFVKYGYAYAGNAAVICYNTADWSKVWTFQYPCDAASETGTMVISGQNIYVQSSNGKIYKFDWRNGPGTGNSNVKGFCGEGMDGVLKIPATMGSVTGAAWGSGPTSLVANAGCIFAKSSNGMVYCFDSDLNMIWWYQTGGNTYYSAPTVYKDYVCAGMYDGWIYVLNKKDGTLVDKKLVYQKAYSGKLIGGVKAPLFIEDNGNTYLMTCYDDGRGMNAVTYGIAIYQLKDGNLIEILNDHETFGTTGTYLTKSNDFAGAYACCGNGFYAIKVTGEYTLLTEVIGKDIECHSAATLVNNKYLFITSYRSSVGKIYEFDTEGTILGTMDFPFLNYSMANVTVVDGLLLTGNDDGAFAFRGAVVPYVPPVVKENVPLVVIIAIALAVLIVLLTTMWAVLKYGMKWEHPFIELKNRIYAFFFGENYTHNKRSKHKLGAVLLFGMMITFIVGLMSLCIGAETTLTPLEALSATWSSINKGGYHLTYEEMLIYNSRLPRTVAALAVGIGLSVAGAVYQAVIKNPLVEPYIMGVSSGAGTLAIAVIAYNFTFFGLFAAKDPFLTAIAAIIGGLGAFALTMLLAIKTGGKSTNYVLAGIVIGLVFSAIQSILMLNAGNNIGSSLSWLYGSFTSMTWDKVWLVLVPVLTLSLIPIIWAKELNLVLLGEDQAKQMGLDAEKFDRIMLILASILTSFCVAFCGIIGFIGLVIPHLCRMILGGDHRLMLPTAMAFGGFLMILADLLSRILLAGYELPVGAITTCIGVPVFAYLLIKRGKNYDM